MLEFKKLDDCYLVTEYIHGCNKTKITTVKYKFDLSMKQINNDPWIECNEATIKWFNDNYRHKFEDNT